MKIRMIKPLVYELRYDEPVVMAWPGDEFEVVSDEGEWWLVESGQNTYSVDKDEAMPTDELDIELLSHLSFEMLKLIDECVQEVAMDNDDQDYEKPLGKLVRLIVDATEARESRIKSHRK